MFYFRNTISRKPNLSIVESRILRDHTPLTFRNTFLRIKSINATKLIQLCCMVLIQQKTIFFYQCNRPAVDCNRPFRLQWLAGCIDGDGYFFVDSKDRPRFEITTHIEDEHLLQRIKQHFPGSLKARSGAQAIRLRIYQKEV